MAASDRPVVYISYRWLDVEHKGRPGRAPDPRGVALADRLRARGVDVRLDLYCSESRYGYRPPPRVPGDPRDPWLAWAERQVAEADVVLMLCTPAYALSDPDRGAPRGAWHDWASMDEASRITSRVPALWWDWAAIARECDARPDKFIPIGFGPYHAEYVPVFMRGATYLDLERSETEDALMRAIRAACRSRVPRRGVFVSYAHNDDDDWLAALLTQMKWLERKGVELWTDREIEVGDLWHESIAAALDRAKVAVLMVSPDFLASSYIESEELPRMLDAAADEGLRIFWIPIRASAYRRSPIARFQAAHNPDKPLATLPKAQRDQAFVEIGNKLAKVLGIET